MELKSKPALVIIDVQNGFCHPEGTFRKAGVAAYDSLHIVPIINRLRAASHAAKIPVFFMRFGFAPDYADAGILPNMYPQLFETEFFVRDTWNWQIVDELTPDPQNPDEIVINKTRYSAFWRTDFEEQLQKRGINHLILTGFATNCCVEATARDSIANGFHCVTVGDASAAPTLEFHDASLKNMSWFGGVVSSNEVLELLKRRAI